MSHPGSFHQGYDNSPGNCQESPVNYQVTTIMAMLVIYITAIEAMSVIQVTVIKAMSIIQTASLA